MRRYFLSQKADRDITFLLVGHDEADVYLLGLFALFESFCSNPDMGISAEAIAPDLKRYDYRAHHIFYRLDENSDVHVVRVLAHSQVMGSGGADPTLLERKAC